MSIPRGLGFPIIDSPAGVDAATNPPRDPLRLDPPFLVDGPPFLGIVVGFDRPEKLDGKWPIGARGVGAWNQLRLVLGEGPIEEPVHEPNDSGGASEILGQREAARLGEGVAKFLEKPRLSASEAIDRLLEVADEKEAAGMVAVPREPSENFALNRVGVLKFIHQNEANVVTGLVAEVVEMIPQEVAGFDDQVVEIEAADRAFGLAIFLAGIEGQSRESQGVLGGLKGRRVAVPRHFRPIHECDPDRFENDLGLLVGLDTRPVFLLETTRQLGRLPHFGDPGIIIEVVRDFAQFRAEFQLPRLQLSVIQRSGDQPSPTFLDCIDQGTGGDRLALFEPDRLPRFHQRLGGFLGPEREFGAVAKLDQGVDRASNAVEAEFDPQGDHIGIL